MSKSNLLNAPLNIEEIDGAPSLWPWKLKVNNSTLTDNGDGTATLLMSLGALDITGFNANEVLFINSGGTAVDGDQQFQFDDSKGLLVGAQDSILSEFESGGVLYSKRGWITTYATSTAGANLSFFFSPDSPQEGTIDLYYNINEYEDSSGIEITYNSLNFVTGASTKTASIQLHGDNSATDYGKVLFNVGQSAGIDALKLQFDETVFNDGGVDVDFRVEGVGKANALFVHGSDGFVGIGTNTPTRNLDVSGEFKVSLNSEDAIVIGSFLGSNLLTIKNLATIMEGNFLLVSDNATDDTSKTFAIEGKHYDNDLDNIGMIRYSASSLISSVLDFGTGLTTKNGFSRIRFWVSSDPSVLSTHQNMLDFAPSTIVFNNTPTAFDIDLQVRAVGEDNALFVQGSDGYVGIHTGAPQAPLSLPDNTAIGLGSAGDVLIDFDSVLSVGMFDGGNWLMNSTNQLQFGDLDTYIAQLTDGHLDLTADTSIDMNGIVEFESGIIVEADNKVNDYSMTTADYEVFIDGSSNTVDITMLASPENGRRQEFACIDNTNKVQLLRNGKLIFGNASDIEMIEGETFILTYDSTSGGWW